MLRRVHAFVVAYIRPLTYAYAYRRAQNRLVDQFTLAADDDVAKDEVTVDIAIQGV